MKFKELVVLLPCHSLEDFPVYHEGEPAQGLLAAWSALWHPALVASAEAAPTWSRADYLPETLEGRLFVIPQVSESLIPAGWAERARGQGATVVRDTAVRAEIVAAALAGLDDETRARDWPLVPDFLALGVGFLQVELLTRQMRYMSHIDQIYFQNEVVAAAMAASRGDASDARAHLANCYDILAQARDHFYPVDSYLIDLTLVAPTTIGASLRKELAGEQPLNLLCSGEVIEQMAAAEPQTLAMLRSAVERGTVSIVGGEYRELELPLEPSETVLAEFLRGRAAYERHLGQSPRIFGRRKFGLSPALPQLLQKLGFTGALHVTFDGGRFPQGHNAKIRWEGSDGSAIDALARAPLDASRAESYLSFSRTLGESMDRDHVAALCLAHWPGMASEFFDDLKIIAGYGPTLGKFLTLDNFFSITDTAGSLSRFLPDEYQTPYLRASVSGGERDPISRHVESRRVQALRYATETVATLATLLAGQRSTTEDAPQEVAGSLDAELQRFARGTAGRGSDLAGHLVINPASFSRRATLEVAGYETPPQGEPIKAACSSGGTTQLVVEVPAAGFAWFGPSPVKSTKKGNAARVLLAEGTTLRNEHLAAFVNPTTGALQSVRLYTRRGNQFGQQIAFRAPATRPAGVAGSNLEEAELYSVMAADRVEVTAATEVFGEITSTGRLVEQSGETLAHFTQKTRLWRGSRIIGIEITLTPDVRPGANPWDSYYAARFAWPKAEAQIWRSSGEGMHPTEAERFEAPDAIEIHDGEHRMAILTGGLPYHRRSGDRMLDTLLLVRGEEARTFQFAIAVESPCPMTAATERWLPQQKLVTPALCPASGPSGWLFHLSARNVVATHWSPLFDGQRVKGIRVRLIETEGRAGRIHLSAMKSVKRAWQTDFLGQVLCDLPLDESGKVVIDFALYEWVQVDVEFA